MGTYIRYVITFIVLEKNVSFAEEVPISVTTGVYWKPVDEAIIYESSVPLVYRSKWPGAEMAYLSRPANSGFCGQTANDPQCVVYSWLLQVDKEVGRRIKWLNESIGEEATTPNNFVKARGTRSIHFLGKIAHWCCGIATSRQLKPLFTNQQKMSVFEQDLNEQVAEAFAEIDNVTLNMKEYSTHMEQVFSQVIDVGVNITKTLDRFQQHMFTSDLKSDHKSFSLLQLSTHHVIRQLQIIQLISRLEIISQCRERKLPNVIVSLTKLKLDLVNLSSAIQEDGYELVIPVEDITKYLKLEIADCVIAGNEIIINVNVPIRRRESKWKLFEPIAVPFAWENNTCIVQHGASFVAVDHERARSIGGAATRGCQPHEQPLCYVPRYTSDSVTGSLCLRKMFYGATIQELRASCVFSCVTEATAQVNRVSDFTYILTHVQTPVRLSCRYSPNNTLAVPSRKRLGALEVTVPCDCNLLSINEVLVTESYPCSKEKLSFPQMVHILPAPWSKLKSLKISPSQQLSSNSFNTLEECLEENWPSQIPHWNLSLTKHNINSARPMLQFPIHERDWYVTISTVLHGIVTALVIVIVVRNPHLIGLGFQHVVRADDRIALTDNHEPPVVELVISILIFLLFVSEARTLWRLFKRCKTSKPNESVEMVVKGAAVESDNLPKNVPVAEVDGRELRITLEWANNANRATSASST